PPNLSDVKPSSTIQDQRDEVKSYFTKGDYIKALELYEVILKDPQHTPEDEKLATNWDLRCKNLD
ncbi:2908_t:CDS:1, partial [Acaulospora colombiana]